MNLQLQRIREERGIKQQEMADMLGMKVRTYASWERQEVGLSLENACRCAVILECTLEELAGVELDRRPSDESARMDYRQNMLNERFERLNNAGKDRVIGYADDLTAVPAYMAAHKNSAPAEAMGA